MDTAPLPLYGTITESAGESPSAVVQADTDRLGVPAVWLVLNDRYPFIAVHADGALALAASDGSLHRYLPVAFTEAGRVVVCERVR